MADGQLISNETWVVMVADAEKDAAEIVKLDPARFDITAYPSDLRPYAAIAAAEVLVGKTPEKAMEMLWALESRPGLVGYGYAKVFRSWYAADRYGAAEYLMRQNLASTKWVNTINFVAREWAENAPDLFGRFLDVIPEERRDDVILGVILDGQKSSCIDSSSLLDAIRDPDRRRLAAEGIRSNR